MTSSLCLRSAVAFVCVAAAAGCSSPAEGEPPPRPAAAAPPPVAEAPAPDPDPADAGPAEEDSPDALSGAGLRREYGPKPPPVREWIEITLRSTPPGATVSVDGALVGTTPTFWRGRKVPAAREFRFRLDRHQPAEFRFVPVRSGVLHPTLTATGSDDDRP